MPSKKKLNDRVRARYPKGTLVMDKERKKYGLVTELKQINTIMGGESAGHVVSVLWQDSGRIEHIPGWLAAETLQLTKKPS